MPSSTRYRGTRSHADGRRSALPQPRHHRRPRPRPGAVDAQGDRLHRRGPFAPHRRRRQHLDGDDALQLPPAPPGRAGEGGHPLGGRDADGVQHHRHQRRRHHGNRRDEGVPGEPGSDRRLHRAGRARASLRRDGDAGCLRQDDPRRRDGAAPAEPALAPALWRLDCAGTFRRARRDHPGRVRGGGSARGRTPSARAPQGARGRGLPGQRRLRRPVHREHHGAGYGGAGALAARLCDDSGGRPAQGRCDARRRSGSRTALAREPHAGRRDHARVVRERHRGGGRHRGIDQRGAASAGAGAGSGHSARPR